MIQRYDQNKRIMIWAVVIVVSIVIAFVMSAVIDRDFLAAVYRVMTGRDSGVDSIGAEFLRRLSFSNFTRIRVIRMEVMAIAFFVFIMHPVYGIPTLYEFVYDHRWGLAMLLLAFFVINGLNGDSISCYDYYVQPGAGSQFVYPIIGREREIRSDEWMVDSPQILYHLMRPEGVPFPGVASFTDPLSLLYWIVWRIMGAKAYYSIRWYAPVFFGGLLTAEFLQIILAGDPDAEGGIHTLNAPQKLLVSASGFMIFLSSFYQWWSFPAYFFYIHGAVVFLWYFFNKKELYERVLMLYGFGVMVLYYFRLLYPAWQVPFGYVFLALLIWVIVKNKNHFAEFGFNEWTLIGVGLTAGVIAVILYVHDNWDYFTAMMGTVYPGERYDAGGFTLYKLFNYIPALSYAFIRDFPASESGTIISLFPIPTILIIYRWVKKRSASLLSVMLMIVMAYLTIYCTTGLPLPLAWVTLLSRSTPWRAVDVIGYIQVLFFVLALKAYAADQRLTENGMDEYELHWDGTLYKKGSDKNDWVYRCYKLMMVAIITADIITGMFVRPIEYGYEAVASKPVTKQLREIALLPEENRVLAYNSIALSSFTTACGVDTVNFVNTRPNLALYGKLDPQGTYRDIYNRYAHVRMIFTKKEHTSFELDQQDAITVKLAYRDVCLTGAGYVVSLKKLSADNEWFSLSETYSEDGCYIYRIDYTDASLQRFFEINMQGLLQLHEEGYID